MPLISTLARMVLKARATAPEAGPKNGLPGNGVSREKQTNNNQKSKMKLTNKIVALTGIVAFAATPLFAGTGKTFKETVVVEEETPWYNLAISTGWDSLYMYRGANVLNKPTSTQFGGDWASYGDSIYWTNTAFTWNLTDTDSLSVAGWLGFGLGNIVNGYKEFDLMLNYTKTIDALTLGLGYTFYYIFPAGIENYANELNASVAYELDLGFMTLTPSATYFFNLGPAFVDNNNVGAFGAADGHGGVNQCSSFLNLKLAGDIPVYKDIVSIAPWTALGLNFGYNQTLEGPANDPHLQWFNGFNNWEFGCALPIAFNENITLSGYVAYSYAFENLNGTTLPSTFWGGVNLALAF